MEAPSCSYRVPGRAELAHRPHCRSQLSLPQLAQRVQLVTKTRRLRRVVERQERLLHRRQRRLDGQGGCSCSAGTAASYHLASLSALPAATFDPRLVAMVASLVALVLAIKRVFDTPSRAYDPANPNVGDEYDSWTSEGILEHYWGEHIHLGFYSEAERAAGYKKKDFKRAKTDFVDEMLAWSGARAPRRILDVGCGIGGTSRHLASKLPDATVTGITLSPKQVSRATELAQQRGLTNTSFQVMDALAMEFEDGAFDLVWACESGEHMPDKRKYVEEMTRVLAPGGSLVIATWCQREETPERPFSEADRAALQFLYDEWAHPYFVSVQQYGRLLEGTGHLEAVAIDDWTPQTLPTWRHSNWVGIWDPWPVILKFNPLIWYKVLREIVTLERMHRAFESGLMEYGMAKAVKKGGPAPAAASAAAAQPSLVSA